MVSTGLVKSGTRRLLVMVVFSFLFSRTDRRGDFGLIDIFEIRAAVSLFITEAVVGCADETVSGPGSCQCFTPRTFGVFGTSRLSGRTLEYALCTNVSAQSPIIETGQCH
jgi:hypothetical protein